MLRKKVCDYFNREVVCDKPCLGCEFNIKSSIKYFNYECPNCHGKFNEPSYKFKTEKTQEIGTSTVVCEKPLGYKFTCPFCDIIMNGLS